MSGSLALLVLVHALHVAAGLVWIGGQVILALAVFPALGRASRSTMRAVGAAAGRVLAVSGGATLLLGLVRAAAGSPLRSLAELATTPYGVTLSIAIALTVALAVHGARLGRAIDAALALAVGEDPEAIAPETLAIARRGSIVGVSGGALVLACMVLMHFGL